jgi:hypothetical protein
MSCHPIGVLTMPFYNRKNLRKYPLESCMASTISMGMFLLAQRQFMHGAVITEVEK